MYPTSKQIAQQVVYALSEDIGDGDVTALLIPSSRVTVAYVSSRENAVLCGTAWFDACFQQLDSETKVIWQLTDGDRIVPDQCLCKIQGRARSVLTAERSALNFLQTLSAVATLTRHYVDAVNNSNVLLMDTRKTIPGLRFAQKYAVTVGGGNNQRIGLFDGILIKENHITAAGGVQQAIIAANNLNAGLPIQVEVENLVELQIALDTGAELILLDNFELDLLYQAVQLTEGRAILEASGGITLDTIGAVANTGVDRISIGDLTKNIQAIDFSMRFE